MFPSCLWPSFVLVTHMYVYETLKFTLSCPSSGPPGCSGPSIPFPLTGPFQMPRLGEVRSGLCLGDGSASYLPNLFLQLSLGLGRGGGSGSFFRTPFNVCFHAMVAFLFSMNESAFN